MQGPAGAGGLPVRLLPTSGGVGQRLLAGLHVPGVVSGADAVPGAAGGKGAVAAAAQSRPVPGGAAGRGAGGPAGAAGDEPDPRGLGGPAAPATSGAAQGIPQGRLRIPAGSNLRLLPPEGATLKDKPVASRPR